LTSSSRNNLGRALARLGQRESGALRLALATEAVAAFQQALAVFESELGESHPWTQSAQRRWVEARAAEGALLSQPDHERAEAADNLP
jgi:glycine cleavage system regulatory protein